MDQLWSDDIEVTSIGPGENVKVKLKNIEEEDVSPGFVLCDPNEPIITGRVSVKSNFEHKDSFVYPLLLRHKHSYVAYHEGTKANPKEFLPTTIIGDIFPNIDEQSS